MTEEQQAIVDAVLEKLKEFEERMNKRIDNIANKNADMKSH